MKTDQKDGTSITVGCPDAISFHGQCVDGMDLCDQMASLFDLDRKSVNLWKKVCSQSLIFSAVKLQETQMAD
jgi:hypothetical protein